MLYSLSPLPISSLSTRKSEISSWGFWLAVSSLAEWLIVPISLLLWAVIALSDLRYSNLFFSDVVSTLVPTASLLLLFRSAGLSFRRGVSRRRAASFKFSAALLHIFIKSLLVYWRVGTWHRWPSRFLLGNGVRSLLWCLVWCLLGVPRVSFGVSPLIRWSFSLSLANKFKLYWYPLTYICPTLAGWCLHNFISNSIQELYLYLCSVAVLFSVWFWVACCFEFYLSISDLEKEKHKFFKSKLLTGGLLGSTIEALNINFATGESLIPTDCIYKYLHLLSRVNSQTYMVSIFLSTSITTSCKLCFFAADFFSCLVFCLNFTLDNAKKSSNQYLLTVADKAKNSEEQKTCFGKKNKCTSLDDYNLPIVIKSVASKNKSTFEKGESSKSKPKPHASALLAKLSKFKENFQKNQDSTLPSLWLVDLSLLYQLYQALKLNLSNQCLCYPKLHLCLVYLTLSSIMGHLQVYPFGSCYAIERSLENNEWIWNYPNQNQLINGMILLNCVMMNNLALEVITHKLMRMFTLYTNYLGSLFFCLEEASTYCFPYHLSTHQWSLELIQPNQQEDIFSFVKYKKLQLILVYLSVHWPFNLNFLAPDNFLNSIFRFNLVLCRPCCGWCKETCKLPWLWSLEEMKGKIKIRTGRVGSLYNISLIINISAELRIYLDTMRIMNYHLANPSMFMIHKFYRCDLAAYYRSMSWNHTCEESLAHFMWCTLVLPTCYIRQNDLYSELLMSHVNVYSFLYPQILCLLWPTCNFETESWTSRKPLCKISLKISRCYIFKMSMIPTLPRI